VPFYETPCTSPVDCIVGAPRLQTLSSCHATRISSKGYSERIRYYSPERFPGDARDKLANGDTRMRSQCQLGPTFKVIQGRWIPCHWKANRLCRFLLKCKTKTWSFWGKLLGGQSVCCPLPKYWRGHVPLILPGIAAIDCCHFKFVFWQSLSLSTVRIYFS